MIDFIPFIKKFINKKTKTLDEQIDDVLEMVGGSSEGSVMASAIGSWVITGNTSWTAPYDGMYRLVLVGAGRTSSISCAAGSAVIIVLKCAAGCIIDFNIGTSGGADSTASYNQNVFATANGGLKYNTESTVTDLSDHAKANIVTYATYNNLSGSNSVPVLIPEFRPCVSDQSGILSNTTYSGVISSGRGLLDYIGKNGYTVIDSNVGRVYVLPPIGYGAGGAYGGSSLQTSSNPGCCIITLLKKE